MKILLDEGVPRHLASRLIDHDVTTAQDAGWASVKNGKLLTLIQEAGYAAFLTCDKNMEYQQHELGSRSFAILLLSTNHWPSMEPHIPAIMASLHNPQPGTIFKVECGRFVPTKLRKPTQS